MVRASDVSMQAVGNRIRQLRGELSQLEFAESLGIPQSSVARWETGQMYPAVTTLIAIADACGISLDWLLLGRAEGARQK